jgi:hypothetical protein
MLLTKAFTAPHMPLVLATRGFCGAEYILGHLMTAAYSTFDDLVAGIESALHDMYRAFRQFMGQFIGPDLPFVATTEIVLAGWSVARAQC